MISPEEQKKLDELTQAQGYTAPIQPNSAWSSFDKLNQAQAPQPEHESFLGNLAKDPLNTLIVKPATRIGQTIAAPLVQNKVDSTTDIQTEQTDQLQKVLDHLKTETDPTKHEALKQMALSLVKQATPNTQAGQDAINAQNQISDNQNVKVAGVDFNEQGQQGGVAGVKQIAGDALKEASYLAAPGVAEGVGEVPSLLARVSKGALGGAEIGAIGGAGNELENADSTFGSVAKATGEGALIGGAIGGLTPVIGKGLTKIKNDIKSVANTDIRGNASKTLQDKFLKDSKADWEKPTTIAKSTYNKATQVFKNAAEDGHDIADTLVKNKISLPDNVDDGVFQTADTAEKIRSDAGQMSKDLLRPSLEKADIGVARTPIDEIKAQTIKDIKESKGITTGDKKAQIAKAESEAQALMEKYPEGMSLTDMHDEKITYASNGGYKPVGTVDDNNTASMNRSFGRTLAKQVETKAPSDVPVAEFNAELTKQYQAADYLDALNNKKAPVSLMTKFSRGAAKVVGAKVGTVFGGGLPGTLAGYQLGGALENMLESLPNNIKASFLKNLETTQPEIFAKMQNFIDNGQVTPLGHIKVNNYQSDLPTYITPEKISRATKMLNALENKDRTLDMKTIQEVVKKVFKLSDINQINLIAKKLRPIPDILPPPSGINYEPVKMPKEMETKLKNHGKKVTVKPR